MPSGGKVLKVLGMRASGAKAVGGERVYLSGDFVLVPKPPTSGTKVLKSVDGAVAWADPA